MWADMGWGFYISDVAGHHHSMGWPRRLLGNPKLKARGLERALALSKVSPLAAYRHKLCLWRRYFHSGRQALLVLNCKYITPNPAPAALRDALESSETQRSEGCFLGSYNKESLLKVKDFIQILWNVRFLIKSLLKVKDFIQILWNVQVFTNP